MEVECIFVFKFADRFNLFDTFNLSINILSLIYRLENLLRRYFFFVLIYLSQLRVIFVISFSQIFCFNKKNYLLSADKNVCIFKTKSKNNNLKLIVKSKIHKFKTVFSRNDENNFYLISIITYL